MHLCCPPSASHVAAVITHAPVLWTIHQEEVVALLRQESKGAPVRIPAPRRCVRVTQSCSQNYRTPSAEQMLSH